MARVTVFNTVGSNETVVNFEGPTWGELQSELFANSVSYKGMAAIVGESQVTLESPQAQTPTGDFELFLLPVEVKSGSEDDMDLSHEAEFDGDDEDEEEADFDESFQSIETKTFIKQLEDAKAVLDVVLTTLRSKRVTDPHIIEMQRKAAQLMSARR